MIYKADIDALLDFSQTLGANYTAFFHTRRLLIVTIADTSGASPPAINMLSVKVRLAANLRNYPPSAAPTSSSAVLKGNWGQVLPKIISFAAASGPLALDSVYDVGDLFTLVFDRDTDTAGLGSEPFVKAVVDQLFLFSHYLGDDYRGRWISAKKVVITVLDPTGSKQPMLNRLFASCRNDASIPFSLIKKMDGSDGSCSEFSPLLVGDFGPSSITFTAKATAWVNKTKFGFDSVFMAGDTITLYLDQDTNMGNWNVESMLNTEAVNQLLWFSRSIGLLYTGRLI